MKASFSHDIGNMDVALAPHDSKSPTNNDRKSRLLALPAELRNAIYSLVLVEPSDIVISTKHYSQPPALLATCRQVREEASSLYYSLNRFHFMVSDSQPNTPTLWLSQLPPKALRSIKTFTLESTLDAHTLADIATTVQAVMDATAAGDAQARTRAINALEKWPEWAGFQKVLIALVGMWVEPPGVVFQAVGPHDHRAGLGRQERALLAYRRGWLDRWRFAMERRWGVLVRKAGEGCGGEGQAGRV